MDGVLQLGEMNARGEPFVLRQEDDAVGLDPRIVHEIPRDGKYLVRWFAFPAGTDSNVGYSGADTYIYRLTLTTDAFLNHTWPLAVTRGTSPVVDLIGWNLPADQQKFKLENVRPYLQAPLVGSLPVARDSVTGSHDLTIVAAPSVGIDEATEQSLGDTVQPLPVVITGRIDQPGDVDHYWFQLAKGQKIRWQVDSSSLGFPLDAQLVLRDGEGKVLAESDDNGGQRDAELVFAVPADGRFCVEISDVFQHGGSQYVYRLTAGEVQPEFTLSLASDSFLVTAEKPTEIVVTVERRDGFAAAVELRCEGLPPGISAAPAISATEGETAKTVKLSLTREAAAVPSGNLPGAKPIRVIGKSESPALERPASFAVPATPRRFCDFWLTVK